MTAGAWHPDPTGKNELRYWDGQQWTEHVVNGGAQSTDPLPAAGGPPASEESHARQATATEQTGAQSEPAQGPPAQGQPAQGPPASAGHPGIRGDLIDGRYTESESTAPGPSLQNPKLLRVRLAEPFMARQGSMVAYQGPVEFAYQGSGAAKFLKKAVTGEGLALMRVQGQGDVFIADSAKHVHVLHLTDSGISVNGASVLAFSTTLDWNVERVKGGSIAAGGLFNTTLRGTGWVAITTDGVPVVLNTAEAPTFADKDALVAWSVDLQTSIRSTASAGALIGRGSGEAFQVAFGGHGFVIVQPSEGGVVPPHTH